MGGEKSHSKEIRLNLKRALNMVEKTFDQHLCLKEKMVGGVIKKVSCLLQTCSGEKEPGSILP